MSSPLLLNSGLGVASSQNENEKISLSIKFNGRQSYIVNIETQCTVGQLKEHVAEVAKISARHLNLVLGGQLLNDLSVLEECGVGASTILHAFTWSDDGLGNEEIALNVTTPDKNESQPLATPSSSGIKHKTKDKSGLDIGDSWAGSSVDSHVHGADCHRTRLKQVQLLNSARPNNEHHRFFVFCKLCDCIRPAKLRLCCSSCGTGAFILERGPASWEDIASSTTIQGTCTTPDCHSTTPKFFLRCTQSHDGEVEGTAVVLKHVQSNHKRIACICCESVMSHILIFPCSPGHVICLDCFRQYGSTCLSERRFVEHAQHGYTLPCPAGCTDSHIEESHHFILLGPEKYEHYKVFGAEEYVLQHGGVLCPAVGCGMGLVPDGRDRLIKCQQCQFESCRECKRAYHSGPCQDSFQSVETALSNLTVDAERALRASWEAQSLSLIEETTKCCPNCQTKTERNGGCMHMVCPRCKQEWCWVCVKAWSRDCQADHWFG